MQKNASITPLLDTFLTALVPLIWGTTYWVTTEMLPADRPITTAVIRTLPAGLALIAFSRVWAPPVPWGRMLLLATLNISALQTFLFVSAYRLPGGVAALTAALQPMIALGLVWLIDHQRPAGTQVVTCGFGLLGMLLLLGRPEGNWDLIGVCAALGVTTTMALGVFFARRWNPPSQLLGFTGWQLLIGGLLILPLSILFEPPIVELSSRNLGGYLYLSLIGTLIAYALWFRGIGRLPAAAVSSLALISPITALLIGWVCLGQQLTAMASLGVVTVLTSVTALQWQLRRSVQLKTIS